MNDRVNEWCHDLAILHPECYPLRLRMQRQKEKEGFPHNHAIL